MKKPPEKKKVLVDLLREEREIGGTGLTLQDVGDFIKCEEIIDQKFTGNQSSLVLMSLKHAR